MIGGEDATYVKVKEVEQNHTGTKFAVVYMDDGKFRLRTFGKESRDKETIQREEIEFNNVMWFDDYTMPIDEFPDPFITCCFIDDDAIFVNFFYAHTQTHYHFVWDTKRRQARAPKAEGQPTRPKKK